MCEKTYLHASHGWRDNEEDPHGGLEEVILVVPLNLVFADISRLLRRDGSGASGLPLNLAPDTAD